MLAVSNITYRIQGRPLFEDAGFVLPDGAKERYCKKCGAGNGLVSPPKARYATK